MTRDEILALPAGREMRLLVAEHVFGWKWVDVPEDVNHVNAGKVLVSPELYHIIKNREYQYKPSGKIDEAFYVKEWDTDISAAWEVVEKIADEWGIEIYNNTISGKSGWSVKSDMGFIQRFSTSFPLAVCQVALLKVMEGK